jgi:O-antigen/teichoic acid export membrane protein
VINRQAWAGEWDWRARWRRLWDIDFARHAFMLSAGGGVAQLIVLALSPAIARLYSPEAFGVFAIYAAFASVLAVAATGQYEEVLMLPRYHRQGACLLLFVILLCPIVALILGLPLVIFRSSLAVLIGEPRLALYLWALPLSVMLIGWYQVLRFWAIRRVAFADVAFNAVTRATTGAVLACLMGIWPPFPGAPEGGLIFSQILGEGLGNVLLAWRIRRRDQTLLAWPGWRRLLATARRWRALALSYTAGQGIAQCYGRLPVLAIGWLFGPSAAGLYAWAERFMGLPSLVEVAIGDVYRQRATVEYHQNGRFDGLMRRTFLATTVLAVAPYAVGIALAPILFALLFGPVWREAGQITQILLVGGFFSFATTPVDKAILIFQRTRYMLGWHLARLALKLGAVGATALLALSLATFLWLIVLARIGLYIVDLAYSYHLAKGRTCYPKKYRMLRGGVQ